MAVRVASTLTSVSIRVLGLVLLLVTSLTACAGPEPILASNKRLLLYGREKAADEIETCRGSASRAGLRAGNSGSGNVATGATLGVIAGAAVGASAGLVGGPTGVAIGAGTGAAIGGALGLLGGAYKPVEPDPQFMAFMERCLREQGYEVTGWQ